MSQWIDKILPITLCINYSDILDLTLRANHKFFKEYIVISIAEDQKTREICQQYQSVTVELTDQLHANNAKFNKSAIIHHVQKKYHASHADHWILLMDADILLPPEFPKWLDRTQKVFKKIDLHALYGIQRRDYTTPENLKSNISIPYDHTFVGYFQLYFDKNKYYPTTSQSCGVCDSTFMTSFKPTQRIKLCTTNPNDHVCHLGVNTLNWTGRVTPAFV